MRQWLKFITGPVVTLWKFRPLVVIAVGVLCVDMIIMGFADRKRMQNQHEGEFKTVTGTVKDKQYDDCGALKSMVVGNVLCYVSEADIRIEGKEFPSIGDTVMVSGCLYSFGEAYNKGQFDQVGHYAARGIVCYQSTQYIGVINENGNNIRERLNLARREAAGKVRTYCKVESGTVNTLLLGDKAGLSEYRKKIYTRAGVAHFLVISGLHITSIGSLLFALLTRIGFKRKVSGTVVMILLTGYGICVGFSVSILRALVMYAIRVLADILKKAYDMLNAVAVAMIVVIAIMPRMIADASFIYSFATVTSIAVYHSYVRRDFIKRFALKGLGKWLFALFELPVVLFVTLMPVTLEISYVYSITGVLTNVILALLSLPIIALSVAALIASVLNVAVIAGGCDFLLAILLGALDKVCEFSVNIPFMSLSGKPGIVKLLIYYAVLLFFLLKVGFKSNRVVNITFLLTMTFFVARLDFFTPMVSMLYVGQGECIVVKTSLHSCVMIDCGSNSDSEIGKYVAIPFLQACGIERIDALFVTHTDADHVNGIEYILAQKSVTGVKVANVLMTDIKDSMKNDAYLKIIEQAEMYDINVVYITQDDRVEISGWSFDIMWPSRKVTLSDINAQSLVMVASNGEFDILLTGDSSKETERRLPKRLNEYSVDVLKVAHHGSYTATSTELLSVVGAQDAIISAGINNSYGHPHSDVLERLKEHNMRIYCTKDCGEIDICVKNSCYKILPYKH